MAKTALSPVEKRRLLSRLALIREEKERRVSRFDPTKYGLPDLLFKQDPGETDEYYRFRQNNAVKNFIEEYFIIAYQGRTRKPKMIPGMTLVVSDLFYGRTKRAVLWKPRGSGGSVVAAMVIWLVMVYKGSSFVNVAGSSEQSKVIYDYVKGFWDGLGTLKKKLLANNPTLSKLEMKNGVQLHCIPASEKAARGKHQPSLVIDEASILPGTLIQYQSGMKRIEEFVDDESVTNREGYLKGVAHPMSHPYDGLAIQIKVWGSDIPSAVTEEHRMWAAKKSSVGTQADPEWIRARDLKVGDLLVYPRFKQDGSLSDLEEGFDYNDNFFRFLGYFASSGMFIGESTILLRARATDFWLDEAVDILVSQLCERFESVDDDSIRFSDRFVANWLYDNASEGISKRYLESATNQNLKHFLLGLFRSSGHPVRSSFGKLAAWNWTTRDERLLNTVLYCLNRLGIGHQIGTNPDVFNVPADRGAGSWRVRVPQNQLDQIFEQERDWRGAPRPKSSYASKVWCDENWWYAPITELVSSHYQGPVYDLSVTEDTSFSSPFVTFHNCQKDSSGDAAMYAAMQGPLSEEDHLIFLLSTFHYPTGFFQEHWDYAEDKGFTRYRWTIFHAMEKCDRGMETATKQDPRALEYCKACPLTRTVEVRNKYGEVERLEHKGCHGTARDSDGFQTFDQVLEAKKHNKGTQIFEVEFEGERPEYAASIFNPNEILKAQTLCERNENGALMLRWSRLDQKIVGIDWGMTETAVVLLDFRPGEYIQLLASEYFHGKLVPEVVKTLNRWKGEFFLSDGTMQIYADAAGKYQNVELGTRGFMVVPVQFQTYKEIGIENLIKFFTYERFRILPDQSVLLRQISNYRRGSDGKPVKHDDHGVDALICAGLGFNFLELFAEEENITSEHTQADQFIRIGSRKRGRSSRY